MWIYIHCNFSYTRPYQRMMRATGWKGDSFAASIKGEYPVSFYSHYTNRHTHTYIYNIFKCRMHVEFLIVQLFHSDRHINRGAGCPRWVVHVHNYFNGKPFWKLDIERHVARLVVACTWFDLHDGPSCVAFNRIGDYIYMYANKNNLWMFITPPNDICCLSTGEEFGIAERREIETTSH